MRASREAKSRDTRGPLSQLGARAEGTRVSLEALINSSVLTKVTLVVIFLVSVLNH